MSAAVAVSQASGEEVLALARAVARPGGPVWWIDADNRSAPADSVEQVAASGSAFMIRTREGVVACDVDAEDDGSVPGWLAPARAAVEQEGGRTAVVGSGRAGHHHLWCVLPVGQTSQDAREVLGAAGVPAGQVHGGTYPMRPPLSPHRWGGAGLPVDPPTVPALLEVLTGRPGLVSISQETRGLLTQGDTEGRFRTPAGRPHRTNMARSLATRYVNADQSFDAFRVDLLNPAHAGGAKAQDVAARQGRAAAEALLQRWWAGALAFVKANPAQVSTQERERLVRAVQRTAETYPWTGQAGAADRRVYRALAAVAAQVHGVVVSVSVRTLGERAGSKPDTVSKALRRLAGAGLLTRLDAGTSVHPASYRLRPAEGVEGREGGDTRTSTSHSEGGGTGSSAPTCALLPADVVPAVLPDLFRRGGLPRASAETYYRMPEGRELTVAQVRALVPGPPSADSVRDHLHALYSAGLVDRDKPRGRLWWRLPSDEDVLARLAARLGIQGAYQQQKAKHQAQREKFAKSREGYPETLARRQAERAQRAATIGEVLTRHGLHEGAALLGV